MKILFTGMIALLLAFTGNAAADILGLGSPSVSKSILTTQTEQQPAKVAVEQSWQLSSATATALLSTKIGQSLIINDFPQLTQQPQKKSVSNAITLKRYELFAPGARIIVISDQGQQEIIRPQLYAFSSSKDGVGLLVDPRTGNVTGLHNQAGISMDITGNLNSGLNFKKTLSDQAGAESLYQCGTTMANQPGDPFAQVAEALSSRSASISTTSTTSYQAVIAVDTDMQWMDGKGNNTTTAMNYINTIFVNMNVFMERDLSLRLLIGVTYLRIGSDPIPPEDDIAAYLNDFGEYWRVNQTAVERDFTVLFSGENIASNAFSGVAWLDQYCQNGFVFGANNTAGSYSVNRIGSNASAGFISQFVGHELGHNLGSPHTHCYTPAVDTCFNAEAGCYTGGVSCPVGGKGTIMSNCHFGAPNGAGCGLSNSEYHPTVIGLLNSRITANSPSCIAPLMLTGIFEDGFE
ncbi:MAG: zinc-dependent metalloprotease [Xanthomonadales bacterium]|nr:zinc-dependent metalloprotease [Xanthomonadales bacterium]